MTTYVPEVTLAWYIKALMLYTVYCFLARKHTMIGVEAPNEQLNHFTNVTRMEKVGESGSEGIR